MLLRRDFAKAALAFPFASERYARAAAGLAPLKITDVEAIPTRQWVFLKVFTSEPGLYGIARDSSDGRIRSSRPQRFAPALQGHV